MAKAIYPTKAIEVAIAFKYLTEEEVMAIYRTAAKIEGEEPIFVNIGAGSGTSGLTLAYANPDAHIFTVDSRINSPYGGLVNEIMAFSNTGLVIPTQIHGDSREIAKKWHDFSEKQIDLIFIDDGHLYDEIYGDIWGWYPHMKIGGYMLFHDYGSSDWPDVKICVDQFCANLRVEPEIVGTTAIVKLPEEEKEIV